MICTRCYRDLPVNQFYENKQQCKECLSEIRIFNWRKNKLYGKPSPKPEVVDNKGFNKVNISITFEKEIPQNVMRLIKALKEDNND